MPQRPLHRIVIRVENLCGQGDGTEIRKGPPRLNVAQPRQGIVKIHMSLEFMRIVSDIGPLDDPITSERVLNAQIPLLRVGHPPVRIRTVNSRKSGEGKRISRNTLARECRLRTAAVRVLDVVGRNG